MTAAVKRALLIVLGALVALAALFFVAKLVMPHTAPSDPIHVVTSAPAKARAVAAAADAASAKLNSADGSGATTTTVAVPAVKSVAVPAVKAATTTTLAAPPPTSNRNPFLP